MIQNGLGGISIAWDDHKITGKGPDGKLTSDEWDEHVADQKGHASRHNKGGTDEVDARLEVKKEGADIGKQRTLNLIEGIGIEITATDDPTNEKIDLILGISGGSNALGFVAILSATPMVGTIPLQVEFSALVLNGAAPYTYAWVFGDGGTSIEANPTHIYTSTGPFWVVLTVTDASALTTTSTALIDARAVSLKIVNILAGETLEPAEAIGFKAGGDLNPDETLSRAETIGFISGGVIETSEELSSHVSESLGFTAGGAVNSDDPLTANASESLTIIAGGDVNSNDDFSVSESLVITNT